MLFYVILTIRIMKIKKIFFEDMPYVSLIMGKIVLLLPFYYNSMLMCKNTRNKVLCKI